MLTILLGLVAAIFVVGFAIGVALVGIGVVLEILWIGIRCAIVAGIFGLAYLAARLLFGI